MTNLRTVSLLEDGDDKPINRTAAGLRESLFDMLEKLKSGRIDAITAKTFAVLSMTILKSVEVQIDYERLRLESKVPAHLPEMKLVPPLDDVPKLEEKKS